MCCTIGQVKTRAALRITDSLLPFMMTTAAAAVVVANGSRCFAVAAYAVLDMFCSLTP